MTINSLQQLARLINEANSIILSTHRQCDGDGLGAQLGLFHALKHTSKKVRILNVDATPKRYEFLDTSTWIQCFEEQHDNIQTTDLALIFDTNDHRLVEPLYSELKKQCRQIAFVDHHPVLLQGPAPTIESHINTRAACTGEIVFDLLDLLHLKLNKETARALYTSVVFDTQMFRYIRSSSRSHEIAVELLKFEKKPEEVHRRLFANHTSQKVAFLAHALQKIEFFSKDRVAFLHIKKSDLTTHQLDLDESRDVIDLIMNIETLEAAALIREDGPNNFKLSLRSKGEFEVLALAESIGGGGHAFSSGAYLTGPIETLKAKVIEGLLQQVKKNDHLKTSESA